MSISNVISLKTVELRDRDSSVPHFKSKSSIVDSGNFKSKKLGFDIKVLEPGKLTYPYHYHSQVEEVYVIIEGEVTVRQKNEKKVLKEGDLIFFETGENGVHQLFNHSDKPVRFLGIANKNSSDICKYPDSGKINAGKGDIFRLKDKVNYYDGEEVIPGFWNN